MKIYSKTLISADRLPGIGDFDPPEEIEPNLFEFTTELEVDIDLLLNITPNLEVEVISEGDSWVVGQPERDESGNWYDLDTDICLGDDSNILDYIELVIKPRVPAESGEFIATGSVLLAFYISVDEYDTELDVGSANVKFDFNNSGASNVRFSKIVE